MLWRKIFPVCSWWNCNKKKFHENAQIVPIFSILTFFVFIWGKSFLLFSEMVFKKLFFCFWMCWCCNFQIFSFFFFSLLHTTFGTFQDRKLSTQLKRKVERYSFKSTFRRFFSRFSSRGKKKKRQIYRSSNKLLFLFILIYCYQFDFMVIFLFFLWNLFNMQSFFYDWKLTFQGCYFLSSGRKWQKCQKLGSLKAFKHG